MRCYYRFYDLSGSLQVHVDAHDVFPPIKESAVLKRIEIPVQDHEIPAPQESPAPEPVKPEPSIFVAVSQ